MSNDQNYKVLNTVLVAAISNVTPQKRNTVYTVTENPDRIEAEALCGRGYAERTNDPATVLTIAQRRSQDATAPAQDGEDEDAEIPLGDEELLTVLEGNVDSVVSELPEFDRAGLERLAALEAGGKNRKGVLDAIAAAAAEAE